MDKFEYRLRRGAGRPPFRPMLAVAIASFTLIVLCLVLVEVPDGIDNVISTALGMLGMLFRDLVRGDDDTEYPRTPAGGSGRQAERPPVPDEPQRPPKRHAGGAETARQSPRTPPPELAEAPPDDWDWPAVFSHTLDVEGRFVSVDSNGARVCCGVNEGAHPELRMWAALPKPAKGEALPVDPAALPEIEEVYRAQYWESEIVESVARWPMLRQCVFDTRVRSGRGGATWRLQEIALPKGQRDGKWGPATRAAVQALAEAQGDAAATDLLCDARAAYVRRAARKNPALRPLTDGLLARVERFRPPRPAEGAA